MKFSIITPSYNQGQFIQQTIDSVISQTGDFEIEYFVMDGGSTDNTVQILEETAVKLKDSHKIKFYWQSKKDNGQVDAINQGLIKSTGDIIAYINSDDYYLPNTFNTVLKYFSTHPDSQWLVGNCQVSESAFGWTFFLKHVWPIHLFKSALLVFNTVNQPSVFLRKTLVDKVGLFNIDYHYAFDYDYWLRCLQFSLPSRIFKNLSVFRIQPNSKGNTGYKKQFDEDFNIIKNHTNNIFLIFIHHFGQLFVKLSYHFLK